MCVCVYVCMDEGRKRVKFRSCLKENWGINKGRRKSLEEGERMERNLRFFDTKRNEMKCITSKTIKIL